MLEFFEHDAEQWSFFFFFFGGGGGGGGARLDGQALQLRLVRVGGRRRCTTTSSPTAFVRFAFVLGVVVSMSCTNGAT